MALKYKYPNKQEIPAEQQALYIERDGAWLLDAEGVVDKAKHEEFRTNNIALTNQLKRFEGIDPDAVRQLIQDNTHGRWLGLFGEPGVNVLKLNLALDSLH